MGFQPKSYREFLATAAATAVVATAVAPSASAAQFKDVTDRYQVAVDFAVSKGAKGIADDYFGTSLEIKRVDAAVLLAKVLGLDTVKAPSSGFVDVPARAAGEVNALKEAGITSGKTETTFDSNSPITRGELAIWIQRGFNLGGSSEVPFKDVTDRYREAVSALFENGVTKGISATEFGINQKAKRGDYAIFLYEAYLEAHDGSLDLTLMHTNDTHAHLDDVAKRVTAVNEVRAENPNALLVDAGDVFSGTLYFNQFKGQADLEFMNLMGYDMMTFGNHEFDLGSSEEGHKALADFVKGAKFPFISANADFSKDANLKGLFSDRISSKPENGEIYNGIVKVVDGEKVGFFGLTTEETADISSPEDVTFENYIEEAEKAVAAFEAIGVDKIVAVSHIGYDDNPAYDNDLTLAAEVDGIDVIVGGHSHTELTEPTVVDVDENGNVKDPTIIVQGYQYGQYLGTLDVEFDKNGIVVGHAGELIKVGEKAADPTAAELLRKYSDEVAEVKNTPTGATAVNALENPRTGGDNTKPSVRKNETPLGNVITDGMLAKAEKYNSEVIMALQNGGGIRAAINQGPITVGEVITTLPFGNTLATMTLTGAELKEAFEISLGQYPSENGGFLHVSGAKVEFDSSKPTGERVVFIAYKAEDGTLVEIQDSQTYTIATNAFTAKGGDGYTVFQKAYEEGRVTDLGLSDWENFAEHLASLGEVNPAVEDRIVDVAAE
jgi:2',3'-cyclic-nucleotide 2'-phosphodiesterase (5'-nucleotidase family)